MQFLELNTKNNYFSLSYWVGPKNYHLVSTEKVAENIFLVKCCKCSSLGATSNLLKVAISTIIHLAMHLDLQ